MNRYKIIISLIAGAILMGCARRGEANYDIVPLPQNIEYDVAGNPFLLSKNSKIVYTEGDSAQQRNAELLDEYIKEILGVNLDITTE
ncbi:MAG: glycoside hydrolase family 20 zincin-like fold domain-containing protein, partial [Muribaculaceae bacterium]|nr:glycoside hydrolase family 20 zincin-like fold domain-containing protein [Muribaculaceae bacterium]